MARSTTVSVHSSALPNSSADFASRSHPCHLSRQASSIGPVLRIVHSTADPLSIRCEAVSTKRARASSFDRVVHLHCFTQMVPHDRDHPDASAEWLDQSDLVQPGGSERRFRIDNHRWKVSDFDTGGKADHRTQQEQLVAIDRRRGEHEVDRSREDRSGERGRGTPSAVPLSGSLPAHRGSSDSARARAGSLLEDGCPHT